jgi:hypothetical protein
VFRILGEDVGVSCIVLRTLEPSDPTIANCHGRQEGYQPDTKSTRQTDKANNDDPICGFAVRRSSLVSTIELIKLDSTLLNAQQSALLRLPAELRNRIYSYTLGRHFVHVEVGFGKNRHKSPSLNDDAWPRFSPYKHDMWERWTTNRRLHYYLCKSVVSEDDAYRRSQDLLLNEQRPGEEETMANNWRAGAAFHIDPCQQRHKHCYQWKEFDHMEWMLTPREQAERKKAEPISLSSVLGMNLLQSCSQVYREARYLPFAQNTFGFREVYALIWLLSILSAPQSSALRSLWMLWTAGGMNSMTNSKHWSRLLLTPQLLDRLQGLRVIHLSLSIVHDGMGAPGPLRHEHRSTALDRWFTGLESLRELPLERASVIISDDPESKFGISGYSTSKYLNFGWHNDHEQWLELRDLECFTADEKREWAEQLKRCLLREA